MEWLQILIDETKKTQAQLDAVQADQKKLLAIGLDTYHRSKRNEETLTRNTKDMEGHIKRTDHLQDLVEEIMSIFKWFQNTAVVIKWLGGIGAAVVAIWGAYKVFKGL